MKFIHLSDLHFHRHQADNDAANAVLQYVKTHYPDASLLITGDITDDGHEGQYKNAFAALKPFLGRVFICPGNHDFGAAGNFFSLERAQRFDQFLSGPLHQGGTFTGDQTPVVNILKDGNTTVMLIALDTNLETEHPFDFACGEVGAKQLAALTTILSTTPDPDVVKIVFFHHHPFMHGNPFMELIDAKPLMRALYRRVQVVCFGHRHVSQKWENLNGISYVLAADNAPGKDFARQITVTGRDVSVTDIPIA
jgi:3',5'-cyclic AMP phosphodiesterase CpdA